MKTRKAYSELQSIDDFIDYYIDASAKELRATLRAKENKKTFSGSKTKNEIKALKALLY